MLDWLVGGLSTVHSRDRVMDKMTFQGSRNLRNRIVNHEVPYSNSLRSSHFHLCLSNP
jgi:hypothetical protein